MKERSVFVFRVRHIKEEIFGLRDLNMKYLTYFERFVTICQPKPRSTKGFWNDNLHVGILD
jgi:hypothetical protein